MVQTFSAYRSDHPFDLCPLPRRARSAENFVDVHDLDLFAELLPVDAIPISKQIFRCSIERKRFEHLLRSPFGGRMRCDVRVDDTSAIMRENDEDEQNFKPDSVDVEEVH